MISNYTADITNYNDTTSNDTDTNQGGFVMLDNPMPHADFAISFTASLVSPSFLDPQTLRRLADTARLALGFHPDHPDAQGARRFILAAEVLTDR